MVDADSMEFDLVRTLCRQRHRCACVDDPGLEAVGILGTPVLGLASGNGACFAASDRLRSRYSGPWATASFRLAAKSKADAINSEHRDSSLPGVHTPLSRVFVAMDPLAIVGFGDDRSDVSNLGRGSL